MARPTPNFVILDGSLPDVGRLVAAMLKARQAIESRSWSHPQEPTGEEWWADDPRLRRLTTRARDLADRRTFYRLTDAPEIILVACRKCDWKAAFQRDDLVAANGADYPLPDLLDHLAAPGCARLRSSWDRCGVYYVEPIAQLNRRPI